VPAGIVVLFRRGNKRLTILNGTGRDFLKGDPVGDTLTDSIDVNVEPSSLEQDLVHISDLSKSGNHDAVDSLIAFLDDSRWRIRQEAINALAVVKDKRATPFLIARLADEESGVRQSSASALAKLGDYEAVEPLIVSLNKDDPFVKASCARALGELKDIRAVKPLIAALQNDYLILVANAATALGEIGDRSAIEPLKAHLKDSKNDAVTRVMAGRAIEKLMDPSEFRVMVESIRSEVSHSPDSHVNEGFAENIAETATETLFDLLGIDY
jgi:HEAT repeat protein